MSKEKQIEEMAKDQIWEMANIIDHHTNFETMFEECNASAEELYNAGYRKQKEGEWIVDAWDIKKEEWVTIPYNKHLHADAFCSLCKNPALLDGAEYGVASNYCPNCGAHMRKEDEGK